MTPEERATGDAELRKAAAQTPPAQGVAVTHIEYDPAGADREGEYVSIRNNADGPIDMTGWTLRDEGAKHRYTFPSFTLPAGGEVRLWSGSGADDADNLYWRSRRAIWNNAGDTAILSDAAGNEVSRFSYRAG